MIGTSMPLAPSGNPHRDTTLIGPKFTLYRHIKSNCLCDTFYFIEFICQTCIFVNLGFIVFYLCICVSSIVRGVEKPFFIHACAAISTVGQNFPCVTAQALI